MIVPTQLISRQMFLMSIAHPYEKQKNFLWSWCSWNDWNRTKNSETFYFYLLYFATSSTKAWNPIQFSHFFFFMPHWREIAAWIFGFFSHFLFFLMPSGEQEKLLTLRSRSPKYKKISHEPTPTLQIQTSV